MAHIEFRFVPVQTLGEGISIVSLDCWKATIVFKTPLPATGVSVKLDEAPFNFLAPVDGNDQPGFQRIELGGAYYKGVPIKIKHDLEINIPPGEFAYLFIALQYFVNDGE